MDEGIGKGVESQKTLLLQSCGQTRCLILIIQIDLESRCDSGFLSWIVLIEMPVLKWRGHEYTIN